MRTTLLVLALAASPALASGTPPRFTEEREAAARHFVSKHLPELLPLLDELRKGNLAQYQQQIRDIFQVTEMLADLLDEPRLHELELKIWITENKAHTLVARLATPNDEERRRAEEQLLTLARELVELDIQWLEYKADQLDRELGAVKDELAGLRDSTDKHIRDRFEGLLDQARRRKKPG